MIVYLSVELQSCCIPPFFIVEGLVYGSGFSLFGELKGIEVFGIRFRDASLGSRRHRVSVCGIGKWLWLILWWLRRRRRRMRR